MSNLPPNPFSNAQGAPPGNANTTAPGFNQSQQFGQVPLSQLPPGYAGTKQDSNSNSPFHVPTSAPQNHALQNVNNYNQSGNSSPAFNQPGVIPQYNTSPIKSSVSVGPVKSSLPSNVSSASGTPSQFNANPSPTPYFQNAQQQRQINDNAPPLVPSSQFSQTLVNGPHIAGYPGGPSNQFPATSTPYNSPQISKPPIGPAIKPLNPAFGPPSVSQPAQMTSQPNIPFSAPIGGPVRSSPLMQGPITSEIATNGSMGPLSMNSYSMPSVSGPPGQPPSLAGLPPGSRPGPYMNGPTMSGPPMTSQAQPIGGQPMRPPMNAQAMNGPPMSGQPISRQPISANTMTAPPMSGPPMSKPLMAGPLINRPPMPGPMAGPPNPNFGAPAGNFPGGHPFNPPGVPPYASGPQSLPAQFPPRPMHPQPSLGPPGPSLPPVGPPGSNLPPLGPAGPSQPPVGPPSGVNIPPKTNMQNRYPQMNPPPNMGQYPQQYNTQNMTQQMGNLSVTKQGFDQLWGHQMVDLMQCKHILPEYPEELPEIKLGPQFPDAVNCSPDIFRCTLNRIPETNSLLQKSRLPLGILIHPFKDLNHLPVIQCNTIVRCRSCRTYINPFVYFVDAKRWKCNLCFRVNDLPEEFLFDPVSKSYGDPSRRPEVKSATIEFIAPGEYMLRPPQPAVYLFLLDVSQIARESGYLQVVCDTLKASLDELPGDARTQVGFVCFDAHVHYYFMSEGLTRPKEMTVLDIDDIFLPSPESLLVNLGERMELVKELLTVLPQRYSAPGAPGSALGSALQAAYKLMAPTGGRVTVFQTCLPNVGPGSLQPREDPNARSSKDVAHLSPATDFYKRIALDCSGAQVAVDLFLLNSQYSDLATLSGMSKFSGGSVYHIPLYKSSRGWQADQLNKMLSRYLTRKIGFEAVMRVRATRGVTIHTFHGNFFVRSTDLLSLPNVSPDAGFGMQLAIEESLSDLQHICFQAALLYTSSKGERRIRVHTMSLPVATTLTDVLHSADQQCIIGLLSKMAVDRSISASLCEAREAVMHVAVEALSAHRLAQNLPAAAATSALHAPDSLRLLPLYLLALLKRKAFRTGTSTRLDDRVADMCALKCQPLEQLLRGVYPSLYPLHSLHEQALRHDEDDDELPPADPPRLQLTAERVNSNGAYLLDDGESMIIYVGRNVSPAFLSEMFGVTAFSQIPDEARSLPKVDSVASGMLHSFIERLNDDRPYASDLLVLRDNSPSRHVFTERLVDDRVESAFSYYEFLQHIKNQVK